MVSYEKDHISVSLSNAMLSSSESVGKACTCVAVYCPFTSTMLDCVASNVMSCRWPDSGCVMACMCSALWVCSVNMSGELRTVAAALRTSATVRIKIRASVRIRRMSRPC
jgi:hypothetical protein